jgi:glycosyltransferase involved in cell wall biosynthesis
MKIVHIINSLASGGAEKLLLDTIPIYKKKGIHVDLLVLNGTPSPFMQALQETGCCSIYSLGLHSVYNPIQIFKLIPFIKKYDIAHVHLFPTQYWVVLAKVLSFSKIKLIYTEHSTSSRRTRSRLFKYIDPFFYKQYDTIICISEKVSDVVKEHTALSISKIEIIHNGIELEKFKNSAAKDIQKFFPNADLNIKILIQVASFMEPKDQKTLIKALRYLSDEVKLLLVGEGKLQKECKALVHTLKLEKRVLFLGLRMDVPQLLKTANVVVLSSKYEGLSLSSIEGMASGKPFVASDVAGLQEIVEGAGILFKQGNAKDLANKIERLLKDETYCQEIVNSCLKRAEQYDIQIMVDKHILIYKSLIQ